jgi:hypothetical protein
MSSNPPDPHKAALRKAARDYVKLKAARDRLHQAIREAYVDAYVGMSHQQIADELKAGGLEMQRAQVQQIVNRGRKQRGRA